jgi:RNA polymerase sigma-70 factor (ECF subfamily)
MQLRAGHRFSLSDEPVAASEPDLTDAIEDKLSSLETELSALPENQRVCITGFYLKGLSYAQLQETTGLSYNEVKSHIQNGKRRLRIALTQRYENG